MFCLVDFVAFDLVLIHDDLKSNLYVFLKNLMKVSGIDIFIPKCDFNFALLLFHSLLYFRFKKKKKKRKHQSVTLLLPTYLFQVCCPKEIIVNHLNFLIILCRQEEYHSFPYSSSQEKQINK